MMNKKIIVDLDGTLIFGDSLHILVIKGFLQKPYIVLFWLFWIMRGKAFFKAKAFENVRNFRYETLSYNHELIKWLKSQKSNGAYLTLCSGANQNLVEGVSKYLSIFDEAYGSNEKVNLIGKIKAKFLVEKYGTMNFDYAGNSKDDIPVWNHSKNKIVVNASQRLLEKIKKDMKVLIEFSPKRSKLRAFLSAVRIHQWLKNLLIFLPLLTAQKFFSFDIFFSTVLAFIAFSFCASSFYIFNDLIDLESDRGHPIKKTRPLACGEISPSSAIVASVILLFISFYLATQLNPAFLLTLLAYAVTTIFYTLYFKRIVIFDCVVLSILYTIRIVAGAFVANLPLSFWILVFSFFIFFSLALLKRYVEIDKNLSADNCFANGRGYYWGDQRIIEMLGVACGLASGLILALYFETEKVGRIYKTPELLLVIIPIFLGWVAWIWLQAHRGLVDDDPVVFTARDWVSRIVILLIITTMLIAQI